MNMTLFAQMIAQQKRLRTFENVFTKDFTMNIQQLYTGCLAESAYYIESNDEVAIIDPIRDTDGYIEEAKKNGHTIKYVLETHFHADFVSGHVELANKTGATIVYGPNANPSFDFRQVKDGELLELGNVKFKVLHTPGHTMESTTYLLLDEEGREHAIFTGDTLFIGDVGRPDLAVKTDLTQADLAGHLYDSLRNKIMTLPDEVIVYPAHGQGSACGKNMSSERSDTLGNQKKFNYALRADMTKEEFIKELTTGLSAAPGYFPKNVDLNRSGYDLLENIIKRGTVGLPPGEFKEKSEQPETLVLDVRKTGEFAEAHIPGSVFIGIDGGFAPWAATLIEDLHTPLLIVGDEDRIEEVLTRLSRVGFDNPLGYLLGGVEGWKKDGFATESMEEVEAEDLAANYGDWKDQTIDVRKPGEYAGSHIVDIPNLPLDYIAENKAEYNPYKKYYLHCAGGYRSVIAGSILQKNGVKNVVNVKGGFGAIKNTNLPLVSEMQEA